MINKIRAMLFSGETQENISSDPLLSDEDAAAVALLVEMATIDGHFGEAERQTVTGLLTAKFAISADEVSALIEESEATVNKSTDHFGFTRIVKDRYDHDRRVGLIEMLWEVVYADGIVDDFEANLVRRLAGLLHVSDRESGEARKRVLARLDNEVQGA